MTVDREASIRSLWPMVRALAHRLARMMPAVDVDELIGDGAIGLVRAVDRFDPGRQVPLRAYARRMIVCAMLNGIRERDPVSERARRVLREADRSRHALAQLQGTFPGNLEMERRTAGLASARRAAAAAQMLSLDGPMRHDECGLLDASSDPAVRALARDRTREVREAVALLPERQRRLVAMHYYGELPLAAISARMSISPQRASQLHLAALKRLRAGLPAP